ncbi:MAPEG family protein [Sphingomonas bacterium]|uniref:MAPEG family protein n=1 Tax=Sphingomonas bacterium TaxID=1895847 RepID=UPI0015751B17|nr:MAPEG family protein [Sphingomonas bacterium]
MIVLPVSLTTAGALALIHLWLAFRVSQQRMASKVMVGDQGDPVLLARMRAHANNAEYAPFAMILIVLVELAREPGWWLWAIAGLFVVGRLAHGLGMVRPAPNPLRAGGIMLTWAALAALAVWAIVIARQTPATVVRGAPATATPMA